MYKFLFSQQFRHQSSAQIPMNNTEILLLLMFCLNSWIYLHFDSQMRIAQSLQAILAVASILLMSYYGFTSSSIPYILCTLCTGLLLLLTFYLNVDSLFMLIPLIFLLSVSRIINKLKLILQVLLESLWMFFSIMFCFCLFGLISYYFFSQNLQYFNTPLQSSLTYLQVATLDEIGKISLQNYQKFGFLKSFVIMTLSLGVIHLLININQAIIMKYVYSKRHDEEGNIVSTREQFVGEIRVELKVVRIVNIVMISLGFLFPYDDTAGTLWFLLVLSIMSTFSIMFEHWFQGTLCSIRHLSNILLQLITVILFLKQKHFLFYLFLTGRIFLLPEVIRLWVKIWQVVWEISELVSFSTIFFLIFTFLSYVLYKVETEGVKIEVVLIRGLQFMTLDDWTANIRHAEWYMSVLIVVYVIMLNHIILNALVSQAFGELRVEVVGDGGRNGGGVGLEGNYEDEVSRFMRREKEKERWGEVSDEGAAEEFWKIAGVLGYQMKEVEVEIVDYEEVTHDLHEEGEENVGDLGEKEGEVDDLVEKNKKVEKEREKENERQKERSRNKESIKENKEEVEFEMVVIP